MRLETPLTSVSLLRKHAIVDEDAVTLRLRPLRWRDRVLPDLLRWGGAAATVGVVAGGLFFFASPTEAARIEARAEPTMAPMTRVAPALTRATLDATVVPEEDEEIVIIIEDEEDEEEILIFEEALDAPSAVAMAELHLERRDHELAVRYAQGAVDADPRDPAYQTLLGEAYLLTGDQKAARRAFRRARRLRRR